MAGRASSKNIVNNAADIVLYVKKPASNSSREIRDAILKEHFGYTEADIIELDQKKKGYFYISDTGKTGEWASVDQVKGWKPNAAGEVPITMPQTLIDSLISFREQRADFEVFKVAAFITDAKIRDDFMQDLKRILNYSGATRIEALNNLMNTIAGSGASKPQIFRALRFLTNESGYKDNPFLLVAFAQTTIYQSDAPSMGSSQINQAQIAETIRATNASLYNSQSKSSLVKISKAEAAAINGWTSDLYGKSNAANEANNRRWIERFLTMSPDERDSYTDGDLISLVPPDKTFLNAPTNEERKLQNLEDRFNQTKQAWQKEDNIGAPQPVKTDHRSGELFQRRDDTFEKEGWDTKKKRGAGNGYQPKVSPTLKPNNFNPYSRANVPADGYGAIFSLYLEAAKFQKVNMRMRVITNYLNEKTRLERNIRNENVRLKPPPPEITLKHIEELRKYGRITANPFDKRQIPGTLRQLYILLEEGRAYYK